MNRTFCRSRIDGLSWCQRSLTSMGPKLQIWISVLALRRLLDSKGRLSSFRSLWDVSCGIMDFALVAMRSIVLITPCFIFRYHSTVTRNDPRWDCLSEKQLRNVEIVFVKRLSVRDWTQLLNMSESACCVCVGKFCRIFKILSDHRVILRDKFENMSGINNLIRIIKSCRVK